MLGISSDCQMHSDLCRRSICMAALAVALSIPAAAAAAQEKTVQDKAGQESDQSESEQVEPMYSREILVTARKTSESIQDIPISMSALSSDQLRAGRVYDVSRIAELVPGLDIAGSERRGGPVIRGITTRAPQAGSESAVGQYIDEIYQPRIANQLTALFDVERIEILKGPQGTLFGRNTIAGAMNFVSKKPSEVLNASASLTFGNRNNFEARASVSGPISSTVSGSISSMHRKNDGNIDVLDASRKKTGDDGSNDNGVRAALRWNPTETLEVNASASYLKLKDSEIDQVTGNPAGVLAPNLTDFFTPSTLIGDWRNYEVILTDPGFSDRTMTMYTLRADWKLTDNLTLTSLTGYQTFRLASAIDLDLEVQQIAVDNFFQNSNTFSQEIRLAGDGDILRWNVGANYFVDNHHEFENIDLFNGVFNLISSNDVQTTSWAAFGQAYLTPVTALTLTAGIRYSYDRRDYHKTNIGIPGVSEDYDSDLVPGWDTTPSWDDISYTLAADYHFTPDVMAYVSHAKGYRSGGVQGRVSTLADAMHNYDPETAKQFEIGLKSELWNRRLRLNLAAYHIDYNDIQISFATFKPDGIPSDLIQNAAKARFRGAEVEAKFYATPNLSFDFSYSYNQSKFKKYRSTEDIAASIATMDLPIGDGLTLCDLPVNPVNGRPFFGCLENDYIYDGMPFEFAPRHSFLIAADFEHKFASGAVFRSRLEYAWKDKVFLAVSPKSVREFSNGYLVDNLLRQPSYGLLNANVDFQLPRENWTISLWGRNIAKKRYAELGNDAFTAVNGNFSTLKLGDRRTYGVTLTWHN